MRSIVIIGGGTGTSTLLQGLKKYPVNLSVIVSTADDGGSTGRLRQEWGVMPPGDIRQCLLGLSEAGNEIKELFNYRFQAGELKGHAAGNILIAGMEKISGNISEAIKELSRMLKVKGEVLPATLRPAILSAVLANGRIIVGEHNIDEPKRDLRFKIKNLRLNPDGPANPLALKAIKSADAIVFGPGDLFTSILPNILVPRIKAAINKSRSKKVLVTNIMTKHGQTDGFKASDFLAAVERYLGGKIDAVLMNRKMPPAAHLKKYIREKAEFVVADLKPREGLEVVGQNLLSGAIHKKKAADGLRRSWLRHDSRKLSASIWKFCQ